MEERLSRNSRVGDIVKASRWDTQYALQVHTVLTKKHTNILLEGPCLRWHVYFQYVEAAFRENFIAQGSRRSAFNKREMGVDWA